MAEGTSTLRIGLVLPDVMGTYGDGGNALGDSVGGDTFNCAPFEIVDPETGVVIGLEPGDCTIGGDALAGSGFGGDAGDGGTGEWSL